MMRTFWLFVLPVLLIHGSMGAETVCEPGAIDLVFVMDQSGSVGMEDYKLGLEAAAKLADSLDIGSGDQQSRVGFVIFDDTAKVAFGLADHLSNVAVRNAINSVGYSGGGTDISKGMDAAIKQIFRDTGRKTVPRVMIIITDGQDSSDVRAEQSQAQEMKVRTYALGVGTDVDIPELRAATGDSTLVYTAPDYQSIASVMNQICKNIEIIAPRPSPVPSSRHKPRQCLCNSEEDFRGTWLDIVVVIDSTKSVGVSDFENIIFLLTSLAQTYNIGQKSGQFARIALVKAGKEAVILSNLTTYESGADVVTDLLAHLNDKLLHEKMSTTRALEAAQTIIDREIGAGRRKNAKKVVVIFTTEDIVCGDKVSLSGNSKRMVKVDENDACRLAANMIENGVVLIPIAITIPGNKNPPRIDIGKPCFGFNNYEQTLFTLQQQLCMANCYCLEPYVQYVKGECHRTAECVFLNSISLSYSTAQMACKARHGTLTDVLEKEKQDFLNDLHVNDGFFPYWIGMKKEGGVYKWDSIKEDATNDYSNWGTGQPDGKGDCVYLKQTSGFKTAWVSEQCGTALPTHFFSCQKEACDTYNYCDF